MTKFINQKQKHDQPKLAPVEYIEASASMGKTYSCLKHITLTEIPKGNSKWLYIGKNNHLCFESLATAQEFNCDYNYELINGDDGVSGKVTDRIKASLVSGAFDLMFITHQAFTLLIKDGCGDLFYGCNILVDETLNLLSLHDIESPSKEDTLSKVLKGVGGDKYKLHRHKAFMERTLKSKTTSRKYKDFLKAIEHVGYCFVHKGDKNITYSCPEILDIREVLLHCKRFIMLGAKIENSLTSGVLESLGVKMVPYTEVVLKRNEYLNQERITIYYLTNENKRDEGCSSSLLDGLWDYKNGNFVSVYTWKKSPHGKKAYPHHHTVFEEFMVRGKSVVGDKFIYTVNKKRSHLVDFGEDKEAVSVPYGCYGWNHLTEYPDAVALYTFKPNVARGRLLDYLSEELSFPEIKLRYIEEKHEESAYQLLTRGVIRCHDKPEVSIVWVVVDLAVAKYIRDNHVPNARICDSISLRVPKGTVFNGGHNASDFTKDNNLSGLEITTMNTFNSTFKKKHGRTPTYEEKKEKLLKYRIKQEKKKNEKLN